MLGAVVVTTKVEPFIAQEPIGIEHVADICGVPENPVVETA